MKSEPERFHVCLSMIRKMHDKLLRTKKPFFGVCHAGLGEYVVPVYSGELLLGTVNAGFFQTNEARTRWCIAHACRCSEGLETERALELYAANIATPTIPVDDLLVELQLVAGHLGQSYQALNNTHAAPNMARRYQNSSEDTIFSHAVEYVRINCTQHVSLPELARFCHCSESYLSHLFKRHAGVNVSTYVNKVRVELAALQPAAGGGRGVRLRLQRPELFFPGVRPHHGHPALGVPPPLSGHRDPPAAAAGAVKNCGADTRIGRRGGQTGPPAMCYP